MTTPTEPEKSQPAPPPVEPQRVDVNPDPMLAQTIERSEKPDNWTTR